VDRDAGVLPFKPYPWPFPALFVGILGHVIVLLEDGVDAVRGDADVVSDAEHGADGFGPGVEDLLEPENAIDEILRVGCRGCSTRGLDPWDVTRVAVVVGELLDPRRLISNCSATRLVSMS